MQQSPGFYFPETVLFFIDRACVAERPSPGIYREPGNEFIPGNANQHNTSVAILINLDPQITNPDLIYRGVTIRVP